LAEALGSIGSQARPALKAVVVGNGRCPALGSLPGDALQRAGTVIAADGGAMCALSLGLQPDVTVGDADSLAASELAELGRLAIPLALRSPAKDESDLQLAIAEAVARGATEIVILGALDGDRVEHTVANLLLLALPELDSVDARIVDDRSTVRLLTADAAPAFLDLHGRPGDFVSLFPWGGAADGITTEGLLYPLREEPLPVGPSRGLSNELTGHDATVRLRSGRLLVIHTPRHPTATSAGPANRAGEP
jgi:thiamine pyrophosphokinase